MNTIPTWSRDNFWLLVLSSCEKAGKSFFCVFVRFHSILFVCESEIVDTVNMKIKKKATVLGSNMKIVEWLQRLNGNSVIHRIVYTQWFLWVGLHSLIHEYEFNS